MKRPRLLQTLSSFIKNDKAFRHACALEFPSSKNDEWKYTSFSEVINEDFEVPIIDLDTHSSHSIECRDQGQYNITFVNGFYVEKLSFLGNLQVVALDPRRHVDGINHMNQDNEDIFSALNAACFQSEISIEIPDNVVLSKPIHILFIADAKKQKLIIQPRLEIKLGVKACATVIESYVCVDHTVYFTNTSIYITLGDDANLTQYKTQNESPIALHLSRTKVKHSTNSIFTSHLAMIGGKIARNEINVSMNQQNAHTTLHGLYITKPHRHHNILVKIDHKHSNCFSKVKYKGVIHAHGSSAFDGLILVRPNAIKTDAQMINKNLLLSSSAEASTRPRLEILADDVKCSHGATISQINDQTLFYLRARGIPETEARKMLTDAFIDEMLEGTQSFFRDLY